MPLLTSNVMKSKQIILALLFLLPFQPLYSQVAFEEFGVGTSYWIRSYSTPDETSLLVNGSTATGSTNYMILPSLYTRVKLGSVFGLRGRVGLGQDSYLSSVVTGDLIRRETMTQTIIPANLMVDFALPLGGGKDRESEEDTQERGESKTSFVGGVGISRFFLQHEFERVVIGGDGSLAPSKFSGNDFGINAMVGLRNKVSDNLVLTLYSQYNSGSYNHRIYSEEALGDYSVRNISLKGIEFGVSLGYMFKK